MGSKNNRLKNKDTKQGTKGLPDRPSVYVCKKLKKGDIENIENNDYICVSDFIID